MPSLATKKVIEALKPFVAGLTILTLDDIDILDEALMVHMDLDSEEDKNASWYKSAVKTSKKINDLREQLQFDKDETE